MRVSLVGFRFRTLADFYSSTSDTPLCIYPLFVQAYTVQLFDGRFVEERVLRDAGLLDSAAIA